MLFKSFIARAVGMVSSGVGVFINSLYQDYGIFCIFNFDKHTGSRNIFLVILKIIILENQAMNQKFLCYIFYLLFHEDSLFAHLYHDLRVYSKS